MQSEGGTRERAVKEEEGCRKHRKVAEPETIARSYQLEALEKAIRENTIAFLETGSGKTLIAIMLLRAYAHVLRKPSDSIAVFLVPNVVLVPQQAEAINKHTDFKVGRYWGDMGVKYWDSKTWNEELNKYEVFVMTPQILLDNLRRCFFKLERIKLLIFDECHRACGRHPYACIMTEFYHKRLHTNLSPLPRIFGLTASLINSKGSTSRVTYAKKIMKLETLMNSKVYTVQNESALAEFISFPTLKVKLYKHEVPHELSVHLVNCLEGLTIKHKQDLPGLQLSSDAMGNAEKKITKLFDTYVFCLEELGVWPALKAAECLSAVEANNFLWGQIDVLGEKAIRNFSQDVFHVFSQCIPSEWCIGEDPRADVNAGFLTMKVDCLIQSLFEYRNVEDLRCIIFVERVISAIVLHSLLNQVFKLSCWKTKYMAGNQSGLHSQTRNEQINIVNAFREGSVNIIVATQILEEGLDVQSCNLVVRFDPSATVCSFIQSRGRARMQGSDYLILIKSGDSSTLSKIRNYLASGDIMREESQRQASLPCAQLEGEMYNEEIYCVENTGAIVSLSSSVALLYYYCSRLPSDGYFKPSPRFVLDETSKLCTLYLPKSCPIQTVKVQGRREMLKRIASLEACKKLHEVGALTDHLLPEFGNEEEADVHDCGDIPYVPEQVDYFPGELVDNWPSFCEKGFYHCYSFSLKRNFDYNVSLSDIVLIVKCDLGPDFLNSCFQLEDNRGSVFVNMEYVGIIPLNVDQVIIARRFQITILRMLIDHDMNALRDALDGLHPEENVLRTAYLLLPSSGCNEKSPVIDWDCVMSCLFSSAIGQPSNRVIGNDAKHYCCNEGARFMRTKYVAVCSCILRNSLVFTPHNGHIYCITGILDDLNGNSKMEKKGEEMHTYKEYFKHRHGITLHYDSESLLSGRHLFTVRNWIQRRQLFQKERESSNVFELPPELCVIIMSPISSSTLYSFSFVPSIMHRIESMLLAARLKKIQMNHYTQNVITPTSKVLEAIMTKKCQEEFSLESLETLGDSFLKYAASQQLFRSNMLHHEGLLSAKKDSMISNTTLCRLGCNQDLQGFIRNECFDPKRWAIPGDSSLCFQEDNMFSSTSKEIYNRGMRCMKSKVIADVVEALIGAYLSTGGERAALCFMRWLGMKIDFVSEIPDDRLSPLKNPDMYVNIRLLESLLRYSFRDPSLLVEALTHASYQIPDIPRCYQRLEFLGDSVLDYLMTVHLYHKYPGLSPGFLTDLRSASVNNDCYAHAAVKAGLHKHILHGSTELHAQIGVFLNSFDPSFSGFSFGWEAGTGLPKVLGDVIESIAGAILIDSGFNKVVVWESIRPLLEPLVTPETIKYHPVRELEDLCAKKSYEKKYNKTSHDGNFSITLEVKANGILYRETKTGRNKKTSKVLAAKAMLVSLKASNVGI